MSEDVGLLQERRDGATAVLTLDQPARRNALALPMRRALIAALERIESDDGVRAIVITGSGEHFCSGGDLSDMNVTDLAGGRARFVLSHRLVRLLAKSSKPLVAAIEGWCAGAGVSLALLCDTIVATTAARFATPFHKVGLIADLGLLHTLPLRIGQGRARQMLLYGEPVEAETAERIGLVDVLCAPGEALAQALVRARALAQAAPLPLALTRQHFAQGLDALLDWERDNQSALFMTTDHHEGKTAFLDKRKPAFTGR